MSMQLQTDDLVKMAEQLNRLAESGVKTDRIEVHGHVLELQWNETQTDGSWYVIIGISHRLDTENLPDSRAKRLGRPVIDNPQA